MSDLFDIPMSSLLAGRKIMVFVDMENTAIRGLNSFPSILAQSNWTGQENVWLWNDSIHEVLRMWGTVVRTYAFTCCPGDSLAVADAHRRMKATTISAPEVFPKSGGKSKKVDIALASQMLRQAFLGNYETAVLITCDGDYSPLVKAVQDMGKAVVVMAFSSGLSENLVNAADEFYCLDRLASNCYKAIEVEAQNSAAEDGTLIVPASSCGHGKTITIPITIRRSRDSGPGIRQVAIGANMGSAFSFIRLKFGSNDVLAGVRNAAGIITSQDITMMETFSQMELNATEVTLSWTKDVDETDPSWMWFEIVTHCADRIEKTRFNIFPFPALQ